MKPLTSTIGARKRGRLALATVGLLAVSSMTACGGSEAPAEQPEEQEITAEEVPEYYPEDYQALIDASKEEGGELTIYSNTSEENWAPVFDAAQRKFPWIETISANDLDSDEVFQRVLSEQSTGTSPVDLIVTNASVAWADFAARDGVIVDYQSPELPQLPEFAQLLPSVYAMSTDPMTIAYNTELVTEAPESMKDLADQAEANPDVYQDKITVRDPESSFGFTVTHAFTENGESDWADLERVLPFTRAETSSGTQMEKILAGEYVAGFFVSGGPAFPVVEDSQGLVDVVYPADGTTVLPRGIAISEGAPHEATAKLFLDFVLSEEGQRAVAEGGLSSYREGIEGPGLHTYQEVVEAVGEENVILVDYEAIDEAEIDTWLEKFYSYVEPAPEEES